MKFSWLKFTVLIFLINSIILALSSNSWFFIWMCMELNLMFFSSIFQKMNTKTANAMMKYYITQSISSNIFLLSILMTNFNIYNNFFNLVILLSLWVKLGLFPLHNWFFSMSENLNWNSFFILCSVQKIIPMWLMSFTVTSIFTMNFLLSCNMMYSVIEMFNQTSMRWMLSLSSLSHTSWMLLSINYMNYSWQLYMIIYIMLNFMLYYFTKTNNWNTLFNITNNNNNLMSNLYFMYLMLNFMGFPPFLGFLTKLIIMTSINSIFVLMIFIMNNLMSCYVYMNFFISSINNYYISFKQNKKNYKINTFSNSMLNMMLLFMMIILWT